MSLSVVLQEMVGADFIRNNIPLDIEQGQIETALDIVESPWSRRADVRIREIYGCSGGNVKQERGQAGSGHQGPD